MPENSATLLLDPLTLRLGGPAGWVDITDPECCLLKAFAVSPVLRLARDEALRHVGKGCEPAAGRAFEVQLVRLRKKLLAAGATGPTIKSIRGFGYQLCVPLDIRAAGPEFPSAHASGQALYA